MGRITREKHKVYQGVFDEYTLGILEQLKRKNYFDELSLPIKTGKEGDVYLAKCYDDTKKESYRAIKMYRMTSANFNKIAQYIQRDYRFKTSKGNPRRVILMWTQKEFRNLLLCHKAHMNVPFPYKQVGNVIVMEYIEGGMLKDVFIENPEEFFESLLEQLALMRHEAQLVHGDLSEFNIMVRDQEPIIIDVGQAMSIKTQEERDSQQDLYVRDITNVVRYFCKKYNLNLDLEEVLSQIEEMK